MTTAAHRVKVLTADDHARFYAELATVLAGYSNVEVIGQAKDGAQAVVQALTRLEDALLVALRTAKPIGIDSTKRLGRAAPATRLRDESASPGKAIAGEAPKKGRNNVVNNGADSRSMVPQSPAAPAGKLHCPPKRRTSGLSDRERHVLKEVAAGLSNKEIAQRLGISERTVRNHLSRIFAVLKASNRTKAVIDGMRMGILIL